MKPKIITAILLFVSAYAPLVLILAVKDFDFEYYYNFYHPLTIWVLLSLSFFSIFLLFFLVSSIKRGDMPVQILEIQNRSADLINYTIPYIVSFFVYDLSKMEDVISLSIFMLLLMILTIKSESLFINPILLIAGYNLYHLEFKFNQNQYSRIVWSKFELKKGGHYYIRSLTRFLYLIKEKVSENNN